MWLQFIASGKRDAKGKANDEATYSHFFDRIPSIKTILALLSSLRNEPVHKDQDHANRYSGIGDVESRPMVARDMEVEKVEDMAPNHTVDYVTDCTPNDNAEGKSEQSIVDFSNQNKRTVAMARASALNKCGVHGGVT